MSGIISVVHVMSWTTTIIIALGSLYFSQIHVEDLEGWSLVLVEKLNSVLTNFVDTFFVSVVSETFFSRILNVLRKSSSVTYRPTGNEPSRGSGTGHLR